MSTQKITDDPDFKCCYETRLGILCEDRDPTPEQHAIAFAEATQYLKDRIIETPNQKPK